MAGVKKVTDIIAEIAAASEEQASGIDQINTAVTQMDKMTQQNAALVEEAASAAESMNEQARAMGELIAFFHFSVGGGDRPPPHGPRDARPGAAAPARGLGGPRSAAARSLKVASAEAASSSASSGAANSNGKYDAEWKEF